MPAEITLYVDAFWVSPYDFSCVVALREKGLAFHTVRALVRDGAGLSPAVRELSLTARAPALEHDGFAIAESQAIIEYLEEVFPPPTWPALLPADPQSRARARQVTSFLRTELRALRRERPSEAIFYDLPCAPLGDEARADAAQLVELTTRLLPRPEFAAWSIAHADLTFALLRLRAGSEPLPAAVDAFIDAVCARPSVRDYLDHPRPPHPP